MSFDQEHQRKLADVENWFILEGASMRNFGLTSRRPAGGNNQGAGSLSTTRDMRADAENSFRDNAVICFLLSAAVVFLALFGFLSWGASLILDFN